MWHEWGLIFSSKSWMIRFLPLYFCPPPPNPAVIYVANLSLFFFSFLTYTYHVRCCLLVGCRTIAAHTRREWLLYQSLHFFFLFFFFTCLCFHFSGVFKGFLDEVMKKYGSLVPLCEKDVMGRLKEVFNEDFSHRCVAVSRSWLYKGQIACIATACSVSNTLRIRSLFDMTLTLTYFFLPLQSRFRKPFITREIMKYREKHPKTSTCNFRVFYNKHMLDMDDLATLEGQNWLNDQVRDARCLRGSLPLFSPFMLGCQLLTFCIIGRLPLLEKSKNMGSSFYKGECSNRGYKPGRQEVSQLSCFLLQKWYRAILRK